MDQLDRLAYDVPVRLLPASTRPPVPPARATRDLQVRATLAARPSGRDDDQARLTALTVEFSEPLAIGVALDRTAEWLQLQRHRPRTPAERACAAYESAAGTGAAPSRHWSA